jgi:hypothetical protein
MRRSDDDLAIQHTTGRQLREQCVVQFREVAVERLEIAALDVDVVSAAENQRAKPIPFRLIRHGTACRQLFAELREHRLDRRVERLVTAHRRACL